MEVEVLTKFLAGGKFTKVRFIKRTNGEERVMICRSGVHKGLKGTSPPYDPASHGLVFVWDAQKKHYRSIAAESVMEVSSGPRKYKVA